MPTSVAPVLRSGVVLWQATLDAVAGESDRSPCAIPSPGAGQCAVLTRAMLLPASTSRCWSSSRYAITLQRSLKCRTTYYAALRRTDTAVWDVYHATLRGTDLAVWGGSARPLSARPSLC
eukprot:3692477-Rhodomonas_salina.3